MQYLENINQFVRENLRHLTHAPSVQMQDVPPDMIDLDNLNPEEDADPDTRETREELERRYIHKISQFYFEKYFL